MVSVVVTRNFQITLPSNIRNMFDIAIGETMIVEAKEEEIIIKKIKKDPVRAAFGAWRGRIKETGAEYVDSLRTTWDER